MSTTPKLLAFSGSVRTGSFNKKLLTVLVAGARNAGAEVTLVDFRELPLPLYDGDLEAHMGLPTNVLEFKRLMLAHHGLLLACPEYNSSITPLLKNAIDWASRPAPDEKPLACFEGKVAGLVSASPGVLGGLRGLVHVRAMLGNIKVLVVPEQISISKAHEAFDETDALKDVKQRASVEAVGAAVTRLVAKLIA